MRPTWVRIAIAIWGLWFGAAATELASHSCPMHGDHSKAGGAAAEHAHHGGSQAPADEAQSGCSCLGHCSSVAPWAPVARIDAPQTSLVVFATRFADTALLLGRRAYELPFANGPPDGLRSSA
jgi:hypothetical protein